MRGPGVHVFTTTDPLERVLPALAAATGREPRRSGDGWSSLCPAHDDRNASLSVSVGKDARVLVHCHAGCAVDDVVKAAGLVMADLHAEPVSSNGRADYSEPVRVPVATHVYRDAAGTVLYEKVRREWKEGGRTHKDFWFRRPDPDDPTRWAKGLGDLRRVPYRLPELRRGIEEGAAIFYVEGETCADALAALELTVTTAGGCKDWRPELASHFAGAQLVVVWPDRDLAGWRHAEDVCAALAPVVGVVKVFQPPELDVGELDGADAVDWLARGHDRADLLDAVREWAAPWEPRYFGPCTDPGYVPSSPSAVAGEQLLDDELYGLVDWHRLWSDEGPLTDWLAEPILPTGRQVAIFSPAKVGKSLLALDLAASLATGRPALGAGSAEAPLNVLYVDHEMTEADLRERLDDMGYGPENDLSHLYYYLQPPLTALDGEDQGDELVRLVERHGARLVVIDTMARAVSGDENEADTYRHFYAHTGCRLKQAGVTLLRLDHAGKDVGRGQRGSSSKDDDVDVVWKLTEADASHFILTRTRSRVPWVPSEVALRREEEPYLRHVATADVLAGTHEVLDLLDELAVPVDATVRAAMRTLRAAGHGRRKAVVVAAQRSRRCSK